MKTQTATHTSTPCNATIYGPGKASLVCTLTKGHEGKCGIKGCNESCCKSNPLSFQMNSLIRNERVIGKMEDVKDAAFIVRCANNFEGLLQAAKDLIQQMGNVGAHQCAGWDCSICRRGDLGWNDLEKAIAKAEEK